MTTSNKKLHETLYSDLDHELATTRRMLERYPSGHADWKPHEKSMPLGRLASHVAEIPGYATMILGSDELDFAANPPKGPGSYETADDLVAEFDRRSGTTREALEKLDSDTSNANWKLRQGEKVIFSRPKGELVRHMMINHLIHHRAQLGVYYRMLDVPVPASYGPSADESM